MLDPAVQDRMNTPEIAHYYSRNAHRIAAFRSTLDLLSIPLPAWAERGVSGRTADHKAVLSSYRADNPETLHQATMRKHQERTR